MVELMEPNWKKGWLSNVEFSLKMQEKLLLVALFESFTTTNLKITENFGPVRKRVIISTACYGSLTERKCSKLILVSTSGWAVTSG